MDAIWLEAASVVLVSLGCPKYSSRRWTAATILLEHFSEGGIVVFPCVSNHVFDCALACSLCSATLTCIWDAGDANRSKHVALFIVF